MDLGDLSYDLAANLKTQKVEAGGTPTVTYRHDAWNRLVEVRYDDVLRARYAYNALNWRTFKLADSTGTGGVPDGNTLATHLSSPWLTTACRLWGGFGLVTPCSG